MEMNLNVVQDVITSNRKELISMSKQLDKAHSLNRTLLSALSDSITRDDTISYEDRKEMRDLNTNIVDYLKSFIEPQVGKMEL
tara:strand:- start:14 stop:262 length:249 start_codon:yes stop_codon:yes gene_type:complete